MCRQGLFVSLFGGVQLRLETQNVSEAQFAEAAHERYAALVQERLHETIVIARGRHAEYSLVNNAAGRNKEINER